MNMARKSIAAVLGPACLGVLLWPGPAAQAFVPACTEEVAAYYPAILRSDLSACQEVAQARPEPGIDVKAFVQRLDGTWELQFRTLHGINLEGRSRYHVEIETLADGRALGSAALLECLDARCERTRMSGAWTLELASGADRISLATRGKVLLPQSAGEVKVADEGATLSRFFQQEGVYVAVGDTGLNLAEKQKWDRVVVTERTLTYVNCSQGRVERYVKVSPSSLVDGTRVREMLQRTLVGQRLKD
jgi:hypothetical protein